MDAQPLGINPDSTGSHGKYSDKYSFGFPLLSDSEREVARAYGCLKENGKSIERTVYILDKEGAVRYAKRGMPPNDELLENLARIEK